MSHDAKRLIMSLRKKTLNWTLLETRGHTGLYQPIWVSRFFSIVLSFLNVFASLLLILIKYKEIRPVCKGATTTTRIKFGNTMGCRYICWTFELRIVNYPTKSFIPKGVQFSSARAARVSSFNANWGIDLHSPFELGKGLYQVVCIVYFFSWE